MATQPVVVPETTTQKVEGAIDQGLSAAAGIVGTFNPAVGAGLGVAESLLPTFAQFFELIAKLFHHAHKSTQPPVTPAQ